MGDNGNPKLDPLCELFRKGDPEFRTMSAFNRYWLTTGGVCIGVTTAALMNVLARRPPWAGIHVHAILGGIGLALGEWGYKLKLANAAERDFAYYHYMTLHPEDFPPPKKILFRDYLEPWLPIR